MSPNASMNGRQFVARVRRLGRGSGVDVRLDTKAGKGSHIALYYGRRRTTVKDRKAEIGAGLLGAMCEQLGIDPKDL